MATTQIYTKWSIFRIHSQCLHHRVSSGADVGITLTVTASAKDDSEDLLWRIAKILSTATIKRGRGEGGGGKRIWKASKKLVGLFWKRLPPREPLATQWKEKCPRCYLILTKVQHWAHDQHLCPVVLVAQNWNRAQESVILQHTVGRFKELLSTLTSFSSSILARRHVKDNNNNNKKHTT